MSYRRPYGNRAPFNHNLRTDGTTSGQGNPLTARRIGSPQPAVNISAVSRDSDTQQQLESGERAHQQGSLRYRGRGRARQSWVDNPDRPTTDSLQSDRGRGGGRRLQAWPERDSQNQWSRASHSEGQKQEPDQEVEVQKQNNENHQRKQNKFCSFCGKVISKTEEEKTLNNKVYHKICSVEDIITAFGDAAGTKYVLWMTLPVIHLYGSKNLGKKKKKEFRDAEITELLNNASALRNSNSGFLLIHLEGLDSDDNSTGAFDEFADVKLKGLINDGSLFDDVYKKTRLSEYPGLEHFTNILVLYVESADFLITSDFKTKEALDDCIVDISELTLLKFLQRRRTTNKNFHQINVQRTENLCRLQESRHIQMKAYFQPKVSDDKLALHIFDKLRAAEYISAFSKNVAGGSYLLGLVEEQSTLGEYQRKVPSVKPVAIDDCEVLAEHIRSLVLSTCLVCDYGGNEIPDEDLVRINFIPTADNTGYVVQISVGSVNGVVFYDKEGPVAQKVDLVNPERTSTTRYTCKEWFTSFSSRRAL